MYTSHFGLAEAPFSITPDPRYLYMSERHREALAHLLYGVGEGGGGGFVQLTGEVGTGKTTVCRCLLEQLPPHVDVALILNPRLTALELLATICDELRAPYPPGPTSLKALVDVLYQHLLEAHARGRRTVLILDEAQDLALDVLEQIRLLTNLETTTEKLLQIILIGQPELIRLLDRQKLRQLAQRVTARYHLTPLSKGETHAYIRHRLDVAGGSDAIFGEAALRQVHRLSGGVPRLINVICDRALLGAYTQDRKHVDAAIVRRAASEVLGRRAERPLARSLLRLGAAAAVIAACVLAVIGLTPEGVNEIPGAGSPSRGVPAPDGQRPVDRSRAASAARPTRDGKPGSPEVRDVRLGVAGQKAPEAVRTAPGETPAATRLADVLRNPNVHPDKASAFAALYARWGLDYQEGNSEQACERRRLRELECVVRTGTWRKVRRFNVPAILELVTPAGERHYATVTALGSEQATLELGRRPFTVDVRDIDAFWDGAFILLWKPPALSAVPLSPGARGRDVEWLRRRLSVIDGRRETDGPRDLYDEGLRTRVMAFQKSHALAADGVVGVETLLQLAATVRDPGVPWLSPATP